MRPRLQYDQAEVVYSRLRSEVSSMQVEDQTDVGHHVRRFQAEPEKASRPHLHVVIQRRRVNHNKYAGRVVCHHSAMVSILSGYLQLETTHGVPL